jgi:dienelactone hydrolase
MIRAFAEAGYVVFAPNTLDRPGDSPCSGIANGDKVTTTTLSLRLSELNMVRQRIKQFGWVDQDNIFAAGHSMGGLTLRQYPGMEFKALALLGAPCQLSRQMGAPAGVHANKAMPVISVMGDQDEWYPFIRIPAEHCGAYREMQAENRRGILLKGIPHDVSVDPTALPTVIEFFQKYATRPITSVAVLTVSTAKYDGQWAGHMACAASRNGRAFINHPNFAVRDGKFQWRLTVPAGERGFDGVVSENGMVNAKATIYQGKMVDPESLSKAVEVFGVTPWFIAFDGMAEDDKMTGSAIWGDQPCVITLNLISRR